MSAISYIVHLQLLFLELLLTLIFFFFSIISLFLLCSCIHLSFYPYIITSCRLLLHRFPSYSTSRPIGPSSSSYFSSLSQIFTSHSSSRVRSQTRLSQRLGMKFAQKNRITQNERLVSQIMAFLLSSLA